VVSATSPSDRNFDYLDLDLQQIPRLRMRELYLHFAILQGVLIKKRDSFTFDLYNYELTFLPPSTYTLKHFNESRRVDTSLMLRGGG
jgi:hypothetical protein